MKNWKIVLFAGAAFAASYAVAQTAPAAAEAPVAAVAAEKVTTNVDSKFGTIQRSKEVSEKGSSFESIIAKVPAGSNARQAVEALVVAKSKLLTDEQKATILAFLASIKEGDLPKVDDQPLALTALFAADGNVDIKLLAGGASYDFEPKIEVLESGVIVVKGNSVKEASEGQPAVSKDVNVQVDSEGNVTGKIAGEDVSQPAPTAEVTEQSSEDRKAEAKAAQEKQTSATSDTPTSAEEAAAAAPDASDHMTDKEIRSAME